MSVRLRRLAADHAAMQRAFAEHPIIRVTETEGDPPERYRIEYKLKGLAMQDGRVVTKMVHHAEVYLPLGYPRQAPQCRMLSPIYHPNIAPHAICIGDHWSAGESLAALVARIGELITYQSYNVKSPLNGDAARWAEQNVSKLPIQTVDLTVPSEALRPPPGSAPAAAPAVTVKFPSARVAGEPYPLRAWLDAVLAETRSDPDAATVAEVMTTVTARVLEGKAQEAAQGFAPVSRSTAVGRLPQLHFLVAQVRAMQGMADKQIAALEMAVKIDGTYVAAWRQLAAAAEAAGDAAKAAGARAHLERLGS